MSDRRTAIEVELDRRCLLRLGALAGLGAALLPRLAWAIAQPDLLPHVRQVVERWVGPGKLPGAVASLGLPGQEPQFVVKGAEGFSDPDPVTPDSLFRVYSMTKPITGMATMQLVAQGKLGLDQPLYDVLPKYRHMQVQDRYDGSITALHPAKSPITIRQLLTHSAGIGYTIVQTGPIKDLMERRGLIAGQITRLAIPALTHGTPVHGLEHFADRLAEVPLVYDPGTRWSYSMGLDLLGRVIEVVSGKAFDVYLKETIFDPAGIASTSFRVAPHEAHRLTTNYAALGEILVPIDRGEDSIYLDQPPFPFGGAGLVSTPRDYDRFLRLLAQFGEIDGKRVLAEAAVRQGTANLLPPGVAGPALFSPRSDFGAGGRVGLGPEAGIFGWAGAAGTVGMVDMARALRSQIFIQLMPPEALDMLPQFQTALRTDVMALLTVHS
ncbi:serine hydrolase domain-containing protein [Novosphingobium album (ex Liu et al. 2023)]|uniref:Serine hydrolase n=1 Tax=Novosphingobium album (ex Liu et al. 2023) TaxID=3031130 RepID=A0ABT5WJZ0_9SPHN|nr:serine hydrolase domain-containing protein [Novosphingobium album (ex Liu et al. 2023)]MDE8650361.1 serine hydrolase [Novosphingobium album (ex Liu et al. 2023)]